MKTAVVLLALCMIAGLAACTSQPTVQSVKANTWCVKGTPYTNQLVSAHVDGLAQFKGAEYCKAYASLSSNGQSIDYTYYYNQDGSDVWVVVEENGTTQETHLTR